MSSKSHSLNLYDLETSSEKFEIDVTSAKVDIKTGGSQSVVFNMPMKLVDAVGGDIDSVSSKLHDIVSTAASNATTASTASALVQSNLSSYQISNDASLAVVSQTVTTNKAITDASASSDAAARVQLQNDVETLITAEESSRISDVATLTSSLATEVSNRQSAISSEASARSSADQAITDALAIESGRIDSILNGADVNLDQFAEVVANYSSLNTSALAQIASLNSTVVSIQAQLSELTSS